MVNTKFLHIYNATKSSLGRPQSCVSSLNLNHCTSLNPYQHQVMFNMSKTTSLNPRLDCFQAPQFSKLCPQIIDPSKRSIHEQSPQTMQYSVTAPYKLSYYYYYYTNTPKEHFIAVRNDAYLRILCTYLSLLNIKEKPNQTITQHLYSAIFFEPFSET